MYTYSKAKKSLGQNFLIDQNIISKIIKIGNITKNKKILEIGAGNGNLTRKILESKPKKIIAIEKDKNLFFILNKMFSNFNNVKIVNKNILDLIKKDNFEKNLIVFGNLQYNISTNILASFVMLDKWPPWYESLIFMFQKEVANRIVAKRNTNDYGRLSILCNWRMEIKKHFDVSKNSFFPKPKINSSILSFKPKKNNIIKLHNPKNLEIITRILFSNRRKMINKNLKKMFKERISLLDNLNIDLSHLEVKNIIKDLDGVTT